MVHAEALLDIWRVLYGPASQGDLAAIDRFLRVEERLSRLLGLDRRPEESSGEQALRIVVGSEGEEAPSEEDAAAPLPASAGRAWARATTSGSGAARGLSRPLRRGPGPAR